METTGGGRARQKERTRRALIDACERLLDGDGSPTLEDVAAEAGFSRATAYRYFASYADLVADVLMRRAAEEMQVAFAGDDAPSELIDRVELARRANNDYLFGDEEATHHFVAQAARKWFEAGGSGHDTEIRPGRRRPLIAAALDPWRERLGDAASRRLEAALTLPIGTEAVVALRDVARLDTDEAMEVTRWVCEALVEKALADSSG